MLFYPIHCYANPLYIVRYSLTQDVRLRLEGSARKDTVVDLCSDLVLSHNERGFTHRMRTCKPIYPLNSSQT